MALYNYGFPVTYPQHYQNFNNQYQQPAQQTAQNQPLQNGGIISVPNIDVAMNYLVSPGTTVTFIDENAPCVYTKTRKSQFDQPVFEKFNLVKDENVPQNAQGAQKAASIPKDDKDMGYVTKGEFEAFMSEYRGLQKELKELKKSLGEAEDEHE